MTIFEEMRIYLIGFMGSGKSYVGKHIAVSANMTFVDMDQSIENEAKSSISKIFTQQGEGAFRKMEQSVLHQTINFEDTIIACGGGTPCFFDNLEWMKNQGLVIYLKTPVDLITTRLLKGQAHRPLLKDKTRPELRGFVESLLEQRSSFYEQAHVIYEQRSNGQNVVQELIDNLSEILGH